jgi:biotin carboxyl carrier protein
MGNYTVELNGKSYDVSVQSRTGTTLTLSIDGETYTVSVAPKAALPAPPSSSAGFVATTVQRTPSTTPPSSGGPDLIAPIPGIVSDIKVALHQSVSAGDTVIVLEAMKMENPIKAHRSGKIAHIHVTRGQDVAHGARLLTIEE